MANITHKNQVTKGHCPECGPNKNAHILAIHKDVDGCEQKSVSLHTNYCILKCGGCSQIYFQTASIFSESPDVETTKHWPPAHKHNSSVNLKVLETFDRELHDLYFESCQAFDHGLNRLAAIGLRCTFERGADLCGFGNILRFEKKLEHLFNGGIISAKERSILAVVIEAGNAATHRSWRPSDEELAQLFSAIDNFILNQKYPIALLEKIKVTLPPKQKTEKGQ